MRRALTARALIAPAVLLLALPPSASIDGKWDLTVTGAEAAWPSWIEVSAGHGKPSVRVVGRVGSVHPATHVKLAGSQLSFRTTEWLGKEAHVTWHLRLDGSHLTGTQQASGDAPSQIDGVRAPALNDARPDLWSAPEPLFDGHDLNGWEPDNPAASHWRVIDGVLLNEKPGANLRTTATFRDFRLHIGYSCPAGGNSGVYLRGRYEVQIEYEPAGKNDPLHSMGSIYGFLAPEVPVEPRPGEWESYDITLVGRMVTVVRDDVLIVDHREIPGITGGALDSKEGEPGPILLQGDHTGGVRFRNITISHRLP